MTLDLLFDRIDINTYIGVISEREDLTWQHIQDYSSLPWPADAISRLAPLTYITQHPDKSWDYLEISKRKDLTIDFIQHFQDLLDWESIVRNIDFQTAFKNPQLPFDLMLTQNITPDDILEHSALPWNYYRLSDYIDINFVYVNPELPWSWNKLSRRINLSFIQQNPQFKWNYNNLGVNPNLTAEYVVKYIDQKWKWLDVYKNIPLVDIIKYNLHARSFKDFQIVYSDYCIEYQELLPPLDWLILSYNASLDSIDKYTNKPWQISINKNITIEYVLAHPDKPWSFRELSGNNQITLQDVLDHWDKPWSIDQVLKYKY